jgi:transposase-like protein
MTKHSPFPSFKTSPEIVRLAVMMYVRFPLSLRNVEDLLQERGIDISYKTVRFWWNRFWSCHAYVLVQQLIYAAFRSKAKGLLPPSDEWRWRGL